MSTAKIISLIFCVFLLPVSRTFSQYIDKKYTIKDPFKKMHSWKGKKFPSTNIKMLNIKATKGKIVVINLWSTTCRPCLEEIPLLNELVEEFKSKDILFYATSPEDINKINHTLKETDFKYMIVANAQEVSTRLGLVGYPYNIVIDRKGIIRYISTGTVNVQGKKIASYELPLAIAETLKRNNQ